MMGMSLRMVDEHVIDTYIIIGIICLKEKTLKLHIGGGRAIAHGRRTCNYVRPMCAQIKWHYFFQKFQDITI